MIVLDSVLHSTVLLFTSLKKVKTLLLKEPSGQTGSVWAFRQKKLCDPTMRENPQNHKFVSGVNPPTRHWFNGHSTLIQSMNNTNLQYIFFRTAWDFFADSHPYFFSSSSKTPFSILHIQTKCIFAINMYHKVVALKMSCLSLLLMVTVKRRQLFVCLSPQN